MAHTLELDGDSLDFIERGDPGRRNTPPVKSTTYIVQPTQNTPLKSLGIFRTCLTPLPQAKTPEQRQLHPASNWY